VAKTVEADCPFRDTPKVVDILTYKWHTQYDRRAMAILTVRLSEDEERVLARRSRAARMKRATYVRMLIREEPFLTGTDVLKDAANRMGDMRLRVARRK
jgi:hypothetical protein